MAWPIPAAYAQTTEKDTALCRALYRQIEEEPEDSIWIPKHHELWRIVNKHLSGLKVTDPLYPVYRRYEAVVFNNQGVILQNEGKIDSSLWFYKRGLEIRKEINDRPGMAESLNNMGIMYHGTGDLLQAIRFYQEGLRIQEELDDKPQLTTSLLNMGVLYFDLGDTLQALRFSSRCLEMQKQINDSSGMAYVLRFIGVIESRRGNFDKSFDHLSQSLLIRSALNDSRGIAYSSQSIANLYRLHKMYKEALPYYERARAIMTSLRDKEGLAVVVQDLAGFYYDQGNLAAAAKAAMEALRLSRELGFPQNISSAGQLLYRIYRKQNSYTEALEMLELYDRMRDSIDNQEIRKESTRLQLQFDFERKSSADSLAAATERELLAGRIERERLQRNAITGILLLVIIFAIFTFTRYRLIRNQKRIIEVTNRELEKEKQRTEELLLNILPEQTAAELRESGSSPARFYPDVTVMFTDFRGFTGIASEMKAEELVAEINYCYSAFDNFIAECGIEKIKTIGDGYLCAGGLPVPSDDHAMKVTEAAIRIRDFLAAYREDRISRNRPYFEARIGIHTGPVVAGIVGTRKFAYDIWGDTVNIAARIEAAGEPGKINVSAATRNRIQHQYTCSYRGEIETRGKGKLEMYFVEVPSGR